MSFVGYRQVRVEFCCRIALAMTRGAEKTEFARQDKREEWWIISNVIVVRRVFLRCHCEECNDEAIPCSGIATEIAALRSQ